VDEDHRWMQKKQKRLATMGSHLMETVVKAREEVRVGPNLVLAMEDMEQAEAKSKPMLEKSKIRLRLQITTARQLLHGKHEFDCTSSSAIIQVL